MTTITSEFAADLAREVEMEIFLRTLGDGGMEKTTSVVMYHRDLQASFRVQVGDPFDGGVYVSVWCAPDPEPLAHETFEYSDVSLGRKIARLIEKAEEEFYTRPERAELRRKMAELDPTPDLDALRVWCAENGITRSGPELTIEDCNTIKDWLTLPEIRNKARRRAIPPTLLDPDDINFLSFGKERLT